MKCVYKARVFVTYGELHVDPPYMNFWSRNIGAGGRAIRIAGGLLLLAATIITALNGSRWLALILGISAAFVLYEGVRGWCLLRACGLKTRF